MHDKRDKLDVSVIWHLPHFLRCREVQWRRFGLPENGHGNEDDRGVDEAEWPLVCMEGGTSVSGMTDDRGPQVLNIVDIDTSTVYMLSHQSRGTLETMERDSFEISIDIRETLERYSLG